MRILKVLNRKSLAPVYPGPAQPTPDDDAGVGREVLRRRRAFRLEMSAYEAFF